MNRAEMLNSIADASIVWDIVVIGGGASGIGTAVDAASRGYKTLLVEQADFGKGTSSRSTKLVHGGVRYLQQGNVSLVLEALKERGVMRRNAPHLVTDLAFVVPSYDWWEGPFYGIGLKLYDVMAGKEGFGPSKFLSKEETITHLPTIEQEGLRGGTIYHDGQFDDARMLINLAQTAYEQGACMLNYAKVTAILKTSGIVSGVEFVDEETQLKYTIKSKVVINATGVFADTIRQMDDAEATPIMTSSQGVHIVLDKSFLPGDTAIMVPQTDDGRVLFAVPWHDKVIVGTTDTEVKEFPLEPIAQQEELDFLLTHAARYLTKDPLLKDVKSIFVGLRPLVSDEDANSTAAISREHIISISRSGLITLAGGKWTTYRKMAEDVVGQALIIGDLEPKACVTASLQIHGYHQHTDVFEGFEQYGSDARSIEELLSKKASYKNKLHPEYKHVEGEVVWAVRHEMARTVEDFLARRTRMLFLDTAACIVVVQRVAELMAQELEKDSTWIKKQVLAFSDLVKKHYSISK
jgi:glycerol-3-phosphate dehydrogenase